jgi:hypothetical protein
MPTLVEKNDSSSEEDNKRRRSPRKVRARLLLGRQSAAVLRNCINLAKKPTATASAVEEIEVVFFDFAKRVIGEDSETWEDSHSWVYGDHGVLVDNAQWESVCDVIVTNILEVTDHLLPASVGLGADPKTNCIFDGLKYFGESCVFSDLEAQWQSFCHGNEDSEVCKGFLGVAVQMGYVLKVLKCTSGKRMLSLKKRVEQSYDFGSAAGFEEGAQNAPPSLGQKN